ncbi:Lipopolysaccharide heptosyltransferase 1 [Kingella potus]|uniref:Lipopolysaccharide heptosyltransferase 1 n=1 Tax=Kingella potus TaxID=265175 RepID=A0A377QZZ3_9NEIS|nr:lipopolysaccharide heptosyltransferase I [Kingella potus]UOP00770.1 lipopolysaccharide heptosyltransferase I [Kingella potus]STR00409.1 Lipopolysaccharide heptosyltransferase 1 [Kingella potus]
MKVLLVRLSSMGDLIHTLPAVSDLSRMRPDVELHWLCEEGFSDIARLHPFVKKIHTLRWRQWRKKLFEKETWEEIGRLKTVLAQEGFDFVLDSQGLLKSALPARMADAPVTGLDRKSVRESLAAFFYSRVFPVEKGLDAVLRNRLLFAQAFDYERPSEISFGALVPQNTGLELPQKPYYAALHASSRDSKLWRRENWLQLAQMLHRHDGGTVWLPWGSEAEKMRAEEMAEAAPYIKVCGKMNLLQAAALLDGAAAVAGVDTGLLHLANALGKPLVGIYTDTDPQKTGVQQSPKAKNCGGVGQMPGAEEVYRLLLECIAAGKPAEQGDEQR